MRNASEFDLDAIGQRILADGRLTPAERQAGFSVLASDADEQGAAAAVWLVQDGSSDRAEYVLQFERLDSWHYLGWTGGSARGLSLNGRPSAASAPSRALVLLTGGSSRSRIDRATRQASTLDAWEATASWVSCAGFRLAAEAVTLQAGERLISVPDHGYVIAAWRSPGTRTRPPIAALRADGSALSELGSDEYLDSLSWQSVLATLDEEQPPGS